MPVATDISRHHNRKALSTASRRPFAAGRAAHVELDMQASRGYSIVDSSRYKKAVRQG